ncbi:MAG: trigger factor [Lachnospiraceae bacterium]|nr:trigger factor [Lachnospiraceae bacterium]
MQAKKRIILCILPVLVLCGCGSSRMKIEPLDYVELGDYKGLNVTRMSTEISEEDLDKQVERMLSAYATKEPVTDRDDVQDGDVANIDYVGMIDGEAFEGGSAVGFDLEIGSGTFIPGFEEGLIGAKKGETVDVPVTFPDEYTNNPALAGKPAVFTVTVNEISKKVLPELTEEFLSEKTGGQFKSVDEIRDYFKTQATASLTSYADSAMHTQLVNQAVENATLKQDIPEKYLEEKKQAMIRTAKSNAEAYGKTYEDYLHSYLNMDEATFLETIDKSTTQIAKQSLVIGAIAETENITVSDEELKEKIASTMAEYGYEKEKDLFETVSKEDILDDLLLEKVQDFLADNAVISKPE